MRRMPPISLAAMQDLAQPKFLVYFDAQPYWHISKVEQYLYSLLYVYFSLLVLVLHGQKNSFWIRLTLLQTKCLTSCHVQANWHGDKVEQYMDSPLLKVHQKRRHSESDAHPAPPNKKVCWQVLAWLGSVRQRVDIKNVYVMSGLVCSQAQNMCILHCSLSLNSSLSLLQANTMQTLSLFKNPNLILQAKNRFTGISNLILRAMALSSLPPMDLTLSSDLHSCRPRAMCMVCSTASLSLPQRLEGLGIWQARC
eukprot:scaffold234804_cov21-Tisochrysis_lutea.AAC.1